MSSNRCFDLPKFLFFTVLTILVVGLAFGYGLYSGKEKNSVYKFIEVVKNEVVDRVFLVFRETPTMLKVSPKHFLQPARLPGGGVTINKVPSSNSDLILLTGFFDRDNGLRLIDRKGEVLADWKVRFSKIFNDAPHMVSPPTTDWNIDIHGTVILPDGSVIFSFEYGGLVKLDRCGEIQWTLDEATHHSVERAEKGGFIVPGRRRIPAGEPSQFPPFETPYREDVILYVSEEGKVTREVSVPGLFYRSGIQTILTATGARIYEGMGWDRELVHLNKIAELSSELASEFPLFEAGDLLLSFRKLNLITVVDPVTEKVKWWQIGPWIRQHDPEFVSGGRLTVFNNNTYRTAFIRDTSTPKSTAPRISSVVSMDPVTRTLDVIFGGEADPQMLSVIRGKQDPTPSGGTMITEFEGGRAIEIDADGRVVWEYINRYDEARVAELTEARVYPTAYFAVTDWSCAE